MRLSFIVALVALMTWKPANGQNVVEWSPDVDLTLTDFQSTSTSVGTGNIYSIFLGSHMDFSFHMSNYEFMFTKNFNSKVNCTFRRDAAYVIAPDEETAHKLVNFANYEFDLCELYARKFRKELYEKKGAFSDVSFFNPIYQEIEKQHSTRYAEAAKSTDLGRNDEKLKELHVSVLEEINLLPDFCKSCKPPKKAKK